LSLTTNEMSPADIYAVTGGGNNGNCFGDQSGWWIILLFLCLGGWGNGFGGNGGNGFVPNYLYATNTDALINNRFDTASLAGQLSGIQSAITDGFASAEVASCNRAMADMERSFASQTAITGGLTNVSSQLANCCCENRLASADLKYTIATENCADRQALNEGVRDILANQTAGIQRILDKLCDQELLAERRENDQLRQQLNMANLQASQVAQTAELRQSGATQLNQLVSELRSCPIPAQPVYGSTPIFTCNSNSGCGCSGNTFFN